MCYLCITVDWAAQTALKIQARGKINCRVWRSRSGDCPHTNVGMSFERVTVGASWQAKSQPWFVCFGQMPWLHISRVRPNSHSLCLSGTREQANGRLVTRNGQQCQVPVHVQANLATAYCKEHANDAAKVEVVNGDWLGDAVLGSFDVGYDYTCAPASKSCTCHCLHRSAPRDVHRSTSSVLVWQSLNIGEMRQVP